MKDRAVLVVEDEALILLDLESLLEEAGFRVVGVPSAEAAIEKFDADAESFSALLTDIRLGQGRTGWELARHIRQANSTIPVVYISGDSAPHWGSEGVQHHDLQAIRLAPDRYRPRHTAQSPSSATAGRRRCVVRAPVVSRAFADAPFADQSGRRQDDIKASDSHCGGRASLENADFHDGSWMAKNLVARALHGREPTKT